MNLLTRLMLFAAPAVIVAGSAAAAYFLLVDGGGDDVPDLADIAVPPGRVSCEVFNVARGYRYHTVVVLNLHDRPEGMEAGGTDQYRPEGFIFTNDITGEVSGTTAVKAHVVLPEQPQESDYILVDDVLYSKALSTDPWSSKPASESQFSIPYIPNQACNALSPDIFLTGLQGTPDVVNGFEATKYHFEDLETDLPDRHPGFGPGSDPANFVNNFSGDIWVADEGGYLIKMDMVGLGAYENGRPLEVDFFYEMSDVNAKITIVAPI